MLPLSWIVTFSLYLALQIAISVPSLYFVWIRRNLQPVKARNPKIIILFNAIGIIIAFATCFLRILEHYPCPLNVLRDFLWNALVVFWFYSRCIVLWFKYKIANQAFAIMEDHKKEKEHRKRAGSMLMSNDALANMWFIKRKHWINDDDVFKSVFLVVLCGTIPAFVYIAFIPSYYDDTGYCTYPNVENILHIYRLFGIVMCFFFWLKFRKEPFDFFWIKHELKYSLINAIVIYTVYFGIFTLPTTVGLWDFNSKVFPLSTLLAMILLSLFIVYSSSVPAYLSYDFNLMTLDGSLNTLENVLADPKTREMFTDFLMREFSLENLLAYDEINQLKINIVAIQSKNLLGDKGLSGGKTEDDLFNDALNIYKHLF